MPINNVNRKFSIIKIILIDRPRVLIIFCFTDRASTRASH